MATVIVDGIEVTVGDEERLNGIQAAKRAGIEVPHYCWHPGLTVVASCRMCLVETGTRNPDTGEVSMLPKVVPACQTPAKDNTIFVTNSKKVEDARAMVEEDLLIRHPIDCPICDKAGECYLQDYHFKYGRDERRADLKPFTSRRRTLGDTVTLFVDRCVMCTRCVRFTREVAGSAELMVVNRGAHEEIDVFPGFPLENKMSGNVVDLCPVGALGDKDFLYSQRVWFMKSHDNVCANCSTGCSIKVDQNQDHIYRLKPRENPHVNHWWMCDEGRYGWKHVHSPERLTEPRQLVDGQYENIEWSELIHQADAAMRQAGRVAAVLSPFLTVEEAYLLAKYVRQIDSDALLAMGPVPIVGEDEKFANGFTIRAEKCPNRRGVEQVLRGFGGAISWMELPAQLANEGIQALWITGGYPAAWHDETLARQFADVPTIVMQDIFASPLWAQATLQLPGSAFAERDGSYVNYSDRLQSFRWAVRPPAGARVEGRVYWQLLNMPGMYNARQVLTELGQANSFFAPAIGEVPDVGIDLRVNQLAATS